MLKLILLIPLFPLLGFTLLAFFGKGMSKKTIGLLATACVAIPFLLALVLFLKLDAFADKTITYSLFDWISAGNLSIPFSFTIDPLSIIFTLIITGVGSLIHLYSTGYMHDDEGFHRFFAYLNLFIFFMLLLVLGSNYLIMFVGWEGVGLCSYLLIGFWFKNTAYNNAAKKAFIMNRIGDLGFLLGMILIYITFGTLTYTDVFEQAKTFGSDQGVITAITLLLFVGAMGKSAQIPLYTWLPDAMAGPTPVSALIHAATMVTAGIYMIARSNILYTLAPISMEVVAITGIITALLAASIGLFQNDIKKVLAYSTVSQLGLMFVALGVGAYTTGVFHVMTHAFFKALLFLGAGSVIHAMGGEQDIRKMGGLKKDLPTTFKTFAIATLAISGIFPLSGFFSKDEILAHAFEHNKVLWVLGLIASAMTAFYMFRLLFLTFYGSFRGTKEQAHHLHESPASMTIPLVVLATLSVIAGFIGMPAVFHVSHQLDKFLEPVFYQSEMHMLPNHLSHTTEIILMLVATVVALLMIYIAYNKFVKRAEIPAEDAAIKGTQKIIYNKYYVDELYASIITKPLDWLSGVFHKVIDNQIIDGFVNGIGKSFVWTSGIVRQIQTGSIGFYILIMVAGVIAILTLH